MRRFLMFTAAILLFAACQKEENIYVEMNTALTITGYSDIETRTHFGTPTSTEIPFYWSAGDCVWLGKSKSNPIADDCSLAQFSFASGTAVIGTGHIFYNMTGEAKSAYVLAEQSADGNLGNDGDFGYATLDEYNSFYLEHKTAYIWFDTKTTDDDMPKLTAITLSTDGVAIAGKRDYNFTAQEWAEDITDGSSTIKLSFAEPHTLKASNDGIMATMVLLPAAVAGKELTVTYSFDDGATYSEVKRPGKDFLSGATQRIATTINKSNLEKAADYELRYLTFEDEDTMFEPYECTFTYAMMGYEEYKRIEQWSDYIPRDGQYGNGHGSYEWYDEGNTELAFVKPTIESWWGISGHAGISDYVGTDEDIDNYDDDNYLFMIDLQAYNVTGGANGSKNFCSQYGYLDPEEYATMYSPEGVLPGLQFYDEVPRVIDHMYVTNTTYAYGVITHGECDFGGSYEYNDDSTFKIIAYGYDSFDDNDPTITEFYLLNTNKRIVTDWTKWDLSVLGEVVRIEFNLVACYEGYGRYGLVIPAYFAYDDVAVRFPKEN